MKINYLAAFFCSLTILFAACTKITSTDIGTGLIPAVDGVNTKDTIISVYAKNAGDSTITPTLSQNHALGYINDPLFGSTDARINFQLSLPTSSFTFGKGDDFHLDSVVLVLSCNGVWGDSTKPVKLYVNELDQGQDFLADTTVGQYDLYISGYKGTYNNTKVFTAMNRLTNEFLNIIDPTKINDSVHLSRDSGINIVRIRLDQSFGQRLLSYDTSVLKSDSTFRQKLKGLQVYADTTFGSASLLKIGLSDANTKLAVYYNYHPIDSATAKRDTTVQYLTVNGTSAHSNYINRYRTPGAINAYLPPNGNPNTRNDDVIFMQAGPGTYATIDVDSVLNKMPNYIVHRAELLMEQAPNPADPEEVYMTAPNLFLLAKGDTSWFVIPGSDTTNTSTTDAVFSSAFLANYSDFGGIPKLNTSTNIYSYSFNLSRYVQGVLTRHNRLHKFILYTPYNEPFQLVESLPYTVSRGYVSSSPANTAGCGRVRLYGGDSDLTNTHRMRLRIVYSVPH